MTATKTRHGGSSVASPERAGSPFRAPRACSAASCLLGGEGAPASSRIQTKVRRGDWSDLAREGTTSRVGSDRTRDKAASSENAAPSTQPL